MQNSLFVFFLILLSPSLHAQEIGNYIGDESLLYAETKQVNQFFRRFNNEEGKNGKRYSTKSKKYREPSARKEYLSILFNAENRGISEPLKQEFIADLTAGDQKFLDFHADDWFAEVKAFFDYQGQEREVTLFLRLEQSGLGYKWVLANIYFEPFYKLFSTEIEKNKKFLHPLSHELDFINLVKAFENEKEVEQYASDSYQPDFLTVFLYEVKKGNLKFLTIESTKFHFFQIENWYFEIAEFDRASYNRGWLISNLVKANEADKDALKKYIYNVD